MPQTKTAPDTRRHTRYKLLDKWEQQGLISTGDLNKHLERSGIPLTKHVWHWVNKGYIQESPESAARRARGIKGAIMYLTPREYKKAWYIAVLMHEGNLPVKTAAALANKVLDLTPNQNGIIWIEYKNLLLGIKAIKGIA